MKRLFLAVAVVAAALLGAYVAVRQLATVPRPPLPVKVIRRSNAVYAVHYERVRDRFVTAIVASDAKEKRVLWRRVIFNEGYDGQRERHEQELPIVTFEFVGGNIRAVRKDGRAVRLDPGDGALLATAASAPAR